MSNVYDIIEDMGNQIREAIDSEQCITVNAEQCGLDKRCGTLHVFDDCIITRNARLLEYYGGFEYVNRENVTSIGEWTIYFRENDSRVGNAIDIILIENDKYEEE